MALDTYGGFKTLLAGFLKRGDLTTTIPDLIYLAELNIEQKIRFAENDTWTQDAAMTAGQPYVLAPVGTIEPLYLSLETDPLRELEVVGLRELKRMAQANSSAIPQAMVPMGSGPTSAITLWATVGGTAVKATSVAHGLEVGERVVVAGTVSYNGLWPVTAKDADTFTIAANYVNPETVGTWRRHRMSLLFDEAPGSAYDYTLFYRAKFEYMKNCVSDEASTWLLDQFPNLILYGTLLEAEPFIKNDQRAALWAARFEDSLDAIKKQQWRKRVGGGELRVKNDVPLPDGC
jgi:hypothetical protein